MRRATRHVTVIALGSVIAASAIISGLIISQSARSEWSPSPADGGMKPPVVVADGIVDAADGTLPAGGASVDDPAGGVANLDPALLSALRAATADASARGIRISITSGWRSPEYQDRLLRDAVAQHGSEEEAARWVATAKTSLHVAGEAVDVGSYDAMDWLAAHGAAYGLCPVYENEPWHFELQPDAATRGCLPTYRDPTLDPRMQQ